VRVDLAAAGFRLPPADAASGLAGLLSGAPVTQGEKIVGTTPFREMLNRQSSTVFPVDTDTGEISRLAVCKPRSRRTAKNWEA